MIAAPLELSPVGVWFYYLCCLWGCVALMVDLWLDWISQDKIKARNWRRIVGAVFINLFMLRMVVEVTMELWGKWS